MSEQQRVVIVTGAAGGIGRELVLGLLGKGLKLAAVDRAGQGLTELAQAAQERQHGPNLMTIEADLARDESIDEIVDRRQDAQPFRGDRHPGQQCRGRASDDP
jgi:NAD(P)-dependent dehydrogenase (short-subunit alcohol dehydrogenase family)